jgi:predicted Zn-dependent protease
MLQMLIDILENMDHLSEWKMKETIQSGEEIFFVNSRVDMTRIKNVSRYQVTLYKNFTEGSKEYKGSSTFSVHPTSTKKEMMEQCKKALENACFVKNQWYPIVEPSMLKNTKKSEILTESISSIKEILKDIKSLESEKLSRINSMEVFVYSEKKTIANSKGLLITSINPKSYLEIITQDVSPKEAVELYFELKFSSIHLGKLAEYLRTMIDQTKDRSNAELTPNLGEHRVILSDSSVADFFGYYLSKTSARAYYEKISPFQPNDSIQGNQIEGDSVDLWLDPQREGSYFSESFDEDGYPLEKIKIIDKGRLIRYWGDLRYSHYVAAKPPTGGLRNFQVNCGKTPISQLKINPYVEIVSFSDFQMNSITGDFGGEIRLGYYFDGEKTIPITKGSIVGNVIDCQNNLLFSEESQSMMNFTGPKSIRIKKATVSGS